MERDTAARTIGRYVLFREVAHGGMATVHLGRLRGPAGFARTVAIKRLHPQYARDPEFVSMFLEEARLAARIQHPNVVGVLDIVAAEGELFLVMDYVHGESFSKLLRSSAENGIPVPPRVVAAIVSNILDGLHAAHEARNERGDPLGIVHRDVSPQNVLIGVDGVARVLDFGIAKATQHVHNTTRDGQLKGKIPYMAPEQLHGSGRVDRRTDVYATSVLLWEALAGRRLFAPADMIALTKAILEQQHPRPSSINPTVPPELDVVVLKGLERKPEDRYPTAHDMAVALERATPLGTAREVGEWVRGIAEDSLSARSKSIAEIENAALPAAASASEPPRALFRSASSEALTVRPPALPGDGTAAPLVTADASVEVQFDEPAGVRRGWARSRVLLGAGSVLAVALVAWLLVARSAGRAAGVSSGAPTGVLAAPSVSAIVPAPGNPMPAPSPVASASATPTDSAPPTASTRPAPWWAGRGASPRPTGTPRAGCNPPYTIDANGVRVPKRQCF